LTGERGFFPRHRGQIGGKIYHINFHFPWVPKGKNALKGPKKSGKFRERNRTSKRRGAARGATFRKKDKGLRKGEFSHQKVGKGVG